MERLIYKTGEWTLKDLKTIPKQNIKVFSCFHCGGGSTMGYKLNGFDVLGGVEIDKKIMDMYRTNFNPKHSYLMGVQDFNKIPNQDLPESLFNLDILDGSPPCSTFSMAGSRENKWGEEHYFREGQERQVLDDLFFHFIETAEKLKPKIVIAENVKGLIIGKAKGYVKQIFKHFDKAGYDTQLFLLNAAFMGVPQRRERTFFIARRKDLQLKPLLLNFNETPIPFEKIKYGNIGPNLSELEMKLWKKRINTDRNLAHINLRIRKKYSNFNTILQYQNEPLLTLVANKRAVLYSEPRFLNDTEIKRAQTFPMDYNFCNQGVLYVCGMSVPPFMMQRVSREVFNQWFL